MVTTSGVGAPDEVLNLAKTFCEHRQAYLPPGYNEAQLRREFIDPFFSRLGWDIDNKAGYAAGYKDVIHEDAIKVGGHTKAPDYCFRIGGVRRFFVEAKRPSINIKDDANGAFHLRRYAWSAKLPLSILTNFHQFAVYDTRVKPSKSDKASAARVLFAPLDELPTRWSEIEALFSREAIQRGAFEHFIESAKVKKGTAEVDTAFLAEIERWRDMLARNFVVRNRRLSQSTINFALEQTIDRIIFLRICEDRGIEQYGQLKALTDGTGIYKLLFRIFEGADKRYNSGLFHFGEEAGRRSPKLAG